MRLNWVRLLLVVALGPAMTVDAWDAGKRAAQSQWLSTLFFVGLVAFNGFIAVVNWRRVRGHKIKTRQETEPIRAWKHALLMIDVTGAFFRGIGTGGLYRADAQAECMVHLGEGERRHPAEDVPDPSCTCGFYALKHKNNLPESYDASAIRLEVELYGRVIVHHRGYRAAHQRVLAVHLPRRCVGRRLSSGGDGECPYPAEHLVQTGIYIVRACSVCLRVWQLRKELPSDDSAATIGTADLASMLGTEVYWEPLEGK